MEEKVLVYIKPICKNTNGTYEYDLYFSETPEFAWGVDWDKTNPSSNNDMTPDQTTYSEIRRIITDLPLKTISETTCYSMEYAIYKILALAWIDIEKLDEYPEHGRCTMHFGDSLEEIEKLISKFDWTMRTI